MAAAAAARVLLEATGKECARRAAPASGLCSSGGLKTGGYCTLAPQQPSTPPPDMKSYLWTRYNDAKKVTKVFVKGT
uniref:Uncharacterized protein n=1 Tax=Sphaerodactylus townsendi TaxID=933632 RepID=A0ACB8FND8_9SAUR